VAPVVDANPPGGPSGSSFRPAFSLSARDLGDTEGKAEIVLTNLILALLLMLLVLFDASIINSTVKENHDFFDPLLDRFAGPAKGVVNRLGFVAERASQNWTLGRLAKYAGLLGITSLIYAALDSDFGFNRPTFVVLISLMLGIGIMTVTFDGAQVWIAKRRFGLASGILFFPFAIFLAIGSVIVSRVFNVHPGIVYGFVAAAALIGEQHASDREEGQIVFIPMLILFGLSLLSWLLLTPFRAWAEDGSFIGAVLEAVAVAMFVGGIQGLLFNLVPLEFIDGQKVWKWSRVAWFAISLPVTFLFVHVLMNPQGDFDSPVEETSLRALFILCIGVWLATGAVWLFFRQRKARMTASGGGGAA